jgi:hypothetical protein
LPIANLKTEQGRRIGLTQVCREAETREGWWNASRCEALVCSQREQTHHIDGGVQQQHFNFKARISNYESGEPVGRVSSRAA